MTEYKREAPDGMNTPFRIVKNLAYYAAGRTWYIPEVRLEKSKIVDDEVVTGKEIDNMHRFIANELCMHSIRITGEELDFLCDITCTKYAEVAKVAGVTKKQVSKWLAKRRRPIPYPESQVLKKWFWKTYLFPPDAWVEDEKYSRVIPEPKSHDEPANVSANPYFEEIMEGLQDVLEYESGNN